MSGQPRAVHPGSVVHTMDHFVIDLRGADGAPCAYFTVYDLALMPEVGIGHVALLRVRGGDAGAVDLAFADPPETGVRMQQRLRRVVATSDVSRGLGTDLDLVPAPARFARLSGAQGRMGYRVSGDGHEVEAWWSDPEPPFWMSAPAGVFHPALDYSATMVAFGAAQLRVDGAPVAGAPVEDAWWAPRLGRPLSSAHVALGEVAVQGVQPG